MTAAEKLLAEIVESSVRLGWDARQLGIPRDQAAADAVRVASDKLLPRVVEVVRKVGLS